ncbi:MAG TPA: hypothetical protein VK499_17360 [Propionibacteriaceae bacterium]|nr:hypothetical protein [Propionibacteriaceae bacterium]
MRDLKPTEVVAAFDSASVLHAATVAALNGQPFPHLGSSARAGLAVRAASRLPWPLLRNVYTRIGASEGINPKRLRDVNLAAVAESFADRYPRRRYPAILLGSSNGALTHLSAAMQVPWLPDTVLVPVAHVGDTGRPDQAMEFARSVAPALLDRNPDIVLHHMHDQLQDVLMAERMSYFRVKWCRLPDAYAAFVENHLAPGGTVVVVNDSSSWPVTRLGPRHVFQAGGRGGTPPEGYLARPHTPAPNDEAAESEWGLDPAFRDDVRTWCEQRGYRCAEIGYAGPQTPAAAVATVMRDWYRARGEPANRLVVPCFILGDPWLTICAAAVPFWIHFAVQPALQSLDEYLDQAEPYRDVNVFLFEHGAESPGIATPDDFQKVVRRHGAVAHFDGLDPGRFPHDIGTLDRYGRVFDQLPRARHPWSPSPVDDALRGLAAGGLSITMS